MLDGSKWGWAVVCAGDPGPGGSESLTPIVRSVSRSNATGIGVSVSARNSWPSRVMLTLALSVKRGLNIAVKRLKRERQGSVPNSLSVILPASRERRAAVSSRRLA